MKPTNENSGGGFLSASPILAPQPDVCNGYGACSQSGCNCNQFEGSGSTCANSGCGHSYSDHL